MTNSIMAQVNDISLPPLPEYTLRPLPPLVPGLPDKYLCLVLPIIAYWVTSLIFHAIDVYDLFPQYRLHTPAEVLKRNHVTRWQVLRDVVLQQIVQTVFGVFLGALEDDVQVGREDYDIAVWAQRIRIAQRSIPAILGLAGLDARGMSKNMAAAHPAIAGFLAGGGYQTMHDQRLGATVGTPGFVHWELMAAKFIYYIGVPALQFGLGVLIVDTWQYFWHRAMHLNKWLYTTFHSRHHRLYVPYAYGALYNHPVEGFLLDTLGTGIAYLIAGMTPRQAMWFFTCSTIKTVDDHCGYALPWDPLQHLTSNNAGYHDVHHQSWGIKTNFSQPFFTFWDRLMGTMWAGGDVSARYERAKLAAQQKVDAENASGSATAAAGVSVTSPYRRATITGTRSSDSDTGRLGPYAQEPPDPLTTSSVAHLAGGEQLPVVPPGKASRQAAGGRRQVLEDDEQPGGGANVLREEADEERSVLRRSPRKRIRRDV